MEMKQFVLAETVMVRYAKLQLIADRPGQTRYAVQEYVDCPAGDNLDFIIQKPNHFIVQFVVNPVIYKTFQGQQTPEVTRLLDCQQPIMHEANVKIIMGLTNPGEVEYEDGVDDHLHYMNVSYEHYWMTNRLPSLKDANGVPLGQWYFGVNEPGQAPGGMNLTHTVYLELLYDEMIREHVLAKLEEQTRPDVGR